MQKRFNQACENNKTPILTELKDLLASASRVLEIGSGTGQHAAHFASALNHLQWHTSDLEENHPSILAWIAELNCPNLHPPLPFKVGEHSWPLAQADAVFTANTTHIMQSDEARLMMQLVAENLSPGGIFCQYGPFRVNGQCTTQSNADFDASLKQRGFGGIRDIAEVKEWARPLELQEQINMPANNFLLVWKKA